MYTIYSKPNCPFCVQAKNLLGQHNKPYQEIHLDFGQEQAPNNTYISREQFSEAFPAQRSLPLILGPNASRIGGFTELKEFLEYDF